MVKGRLVTFLSGEFRGSLYHTTTSVPLTLGGYGNPRKGSVTISVDRKLIKSLIILNLTSREFPGNVLWKVALNKVNLVRQFKSQVLEEVGGQQFAVQVFDVSQLVKGEGQYEVGVTCESSEPIVVESVTLVGISPTPEGVFNAEVMAGQLILEPSESYTIRTKAFTSNVTKKQLILEAFLPSRTATLEIKSGGRLLRKLTGITGIDEVTVDLSSLKGNEVTLTHARPNIPYYPKYLRVYGVTFYGTTNVGPELKVAGGVLEGGKLRFEIINEGDTAAERVLTLGIATGIVLFRQLIDRVNAGESKEVVVDLSSSGLKAGEIPEPLRIRLVYYGLDGQRVRDFKLGSLK